jgi:hypothetical protein
MLKDGFLRFCNDPELACCRAEAELGQLREENARLHAELAAYANSGLLPEQIQELAKAKAEGWRVVLPCKVGDAVKATAYRPYNGHEATIFGKVAAIIITNKTFIRISYQQCRHIDVLDTDFGKTVFLIRETAINALEGGKEK